MMSAVLSNPGHPKYGVATIPFPIPRDQYTYCMDLLEALEIGDTVKADCKVVEFDSAYNVLKRMEQCTVNVEELNYLAKRLESFDTGKAAQFQAMAHKLELFELKDLVNLTFCCQQATKVRSTARLDSVLFNDVDRLGGGNDLTVAAARVLDHRVALFCGDAVGGLLVVERADGLGGMLEGGVSLVNEDLCHDGRNVLVHAAGGELVTDGVLQVVTDVALTHRAALGEGHVGLDGLGLSGGGHTEVDHADLRAVAVGDDDLVALRD